MIFYFPVSEKVGKAHARFGTKWQHSSLLDATCGQLQQRARSTTKGRPWLAAPAAILAHFHPLLWLAEASRFNRLDRFLQQMDEKKSASHRRVRARKLFPLHHIRLEKRPIPRTKLSSHRLLLDDTESEMGDFF